VSCMHMLCPACPVAPALAQVCHVPPGRHPNAIQMGRTCRAYSNKNMCTTPTILKSDMSYLKSHGLVPHPSSGQMQPGVQQQGRFRDCSACSIGPMCLQGVQDAAVCISCSHPKSLSVLFLGQLPYRSAAYAACRALTTLLQLTRMSGLTAHASSVLLSWNLRCSSLMAASASLRPIMLMAWPSRAGLSAAWCRP